MIWTKHATSMEASHTHTHIYIYIYIYIYKHSLGGKPVRENNHSGKQDVDGKIILKSILRKVVVRCKLN
jgi:hypothetical protein